MEEFEKPRTDHFVLKPRVIDPTDKPAGPGDESRISVQKIHAENVEAENMRSTGALGPISPDASAEPQLPKGFKLNEFEAFNDVARPHDEDAVSVGEILQENRAAEEKSGWGRIVAWRRRKSHRSRDFLIVVGTVDLLILLVMGPSPNVMTATYGIAGITLVTTTTAWVMFMVMDPY
ncbi:MAG TPA: hypothetical protein VFE25_07125 [Opitutaceae bacterium]|jgi:hypothetical protein|nr:hypothetical protein [Opitutaceae bacterium]